MIPHWPGLVEDSEKKGWDDGSNGAPFSPILADEALCPDAYDAYSSAYFAGLAYGDGKK